ncbi:chitotriosidase-1 [Trichonephila clavipes]|nr:chitotriosidase-1 [Trichonephila clavipes]
MFLQKINVGNSEAHELIDWKHEFHLSCNYQKFTNLKTYNPKLKVMIAIGGWNEGSKRFSKMVESSSDRQRFVRSAVSFLRKHGFDGLDLDWEYPGFRDGGQDDDKQGYAKLVKELREAFDSENVPSGKSTLLLTMAVPAGQQYIDKGFDVPVLSKNLDFFNMLTYDYHTAHEPLTNHHSPLKEMPDLEDWDPNRLLNIVSDCGLPCHEFEPSTTKYPPCRAAMHVKSVDVQTWKLGEVVPGLVLSSSLDHSSMLRDPLPKAIEYLNSV